jgi:hypothetical protein
MLHGWTTFLELADQRNRRKLLAAIKHFAKAINLSDPTSQEAGDSFFVGMIFGCIP